MTYSFTRLILLLTVCLSLMSCDSSVPSDISITGSAASYSTTTSSIGSLLDNPETKAVLEKYAPKIVKSSRVKMMRNTTLKGIQGYSGGMLTDEVLAQIDAELKQIRPGEGVEEAEVVTANYDEANVKPYTLPDPLVMNNGQTVTDAENWWSHRRPEILGHYETLVFGKVPSEAKGGSVEVLDSGTPVFDGAAIRKQVKIHLADGPSSPSFDLVEYIPASTNSPAPMLLMIGFTAPSVVFEDPGIVETLVWDPVSQKRVKPTEVPGSVRFPIEKFLKAGIGVATYYYGDVDPDFAEGYPLGIRGYYDNSEDSSPAADAWGSMAAWAWSMQLVEDYFEQDLLVDQDRVAIFGASRLSSSALWAAAQDQRFAAVIICCSGKTGAGLMRRNYGEGNAGANAGTSNHWVAKNFTSFYGREEELPIDGHMLLSLIAPRPLLVQTGKLDHAADPKGNFLSAVAASPVYQLLDGTGLGTDAWPPEQPILTDLGYYMHDGGHGLVPESWDVYLKFLEIHLKKQ
ncbi:glucuronyl esterase domain-containing protein [Pseudomaricurvus sp.]|uniref:glucuronyl esterase domain-containing protein n=1 Tax=Pseudomaricurvus sp. TaxID=2004510 RepID=UPI003F6D5466